MKKQLPELLCPAGSPEALDAAIEGGADAVYLGGALFNARMNAKNFGGDALRSAVLRAHSFGVKVYLTLNTLVTDRELPAFVEAAREAATAGVDALIVADLGGAEAIRRTLPGLELHASTQMSAHNAAAGEVLQRLGFSRMVIARETSAEDIATIVKNSPIEIELFIHGALCVSHSGQCLFSSLVGGRSGNRGECAQPCRLPYSCDGCQRTKNPYPLSLKDLSLAQHVPELITSGVASLKIEGRMKAPEYVRDTARIWRRLLDERRAATPNEIEALSNTFSRSGLTDGYYTRHTERGMLGIRSEADKTNSRAQVPFSGLSKKIPLTATAEVQADRPIKLMLSDGTHTASALGEVPQAAVNAPLLPDAVRRSLSKFGGTVYEVTELSLTLDNGLMVPVSHLNDLRRRALSALEEKRLLPKVMQTAAPYLPKKPSGKRTAVRSARFLSPRQITEAARSYFDRIYLPLQAYTPDADGVVLPPIIFDSEMQEIRSLLAEAQQKGARYALCGNLGHLSLAKEFGLTPVGDYRLNLANAESLAQAEGLGLEELILSPELTLPQIRDIGGNAAVIVYGRIPLMTLEKCLIRELADCKTCAQKGHLLLRDRRGFTFPVLREWQHRNVIYNSLPTGMSDREEALVRANVSARHFLFTTESAEEVDAVIRAYQTHRPLSGTVRRI